VAVVEVVVVEVVEEVVVTLPHHQEHPEEVADHLQVVFKGQCGACNKSPLPQLVPT
jgi:hypothetical protein